MADNRIERFRNDTYPETFTVQDDDGSAVDITSSTVRLTVKENAHDSQTTAVIAKSTSASNITIVTGSAGTISVAFLGSDTTNLQTERKRPYVYDVELTLASSSKIHTVAAGPFVIVADITT